MLTFEELIGLPKVELHNHFDGAVYAPIMAKLLEMTTGEEPALAEVARQIRVCPCCRSLTEFLEKFDLILPFLQTKELITEAAYREVLEAERQGVIYLEIRFAPLLHTKEGLSGEEAVEAFLEGIRKGEEETGVVTRGILIAMRHDSSEADMEVLGLAEAFYGKGIVGLDLAGDEANFPVTLHKQLFLAAGEKGIPFTIHAGEAAGAFSVKDALELGADRIGHGIRSIEDPSVVSYLAEHGIPLEICPTSNVVTKACGSIEEHPVRKLMEAGVPVTVSTDDPAILGITLVNEYDLLQKQFGLTKEDLYRINRTALERAFCEESMKEQLIKRLEEGYK